MLRYAIQFFFNIRGILYFLPAPMLFLCFDQDFLRFAVYFAETNKTIFLFFDIYF